MITDYDDKTIHMFVDMGVIESDSYRYEMLLHRRKGAELIQHTPFLVVVS